MLPNVGGALHNGFAVADIVAARPALAQIDCAAAPGKWIYHHIEWIRIQVEQVIYKGNLRVSEMLASVRFRLLFPDVVDRRCPVRFGVGGEGCGRFYEFF